MKTRFTITFLALFLGANAQDYIKTDFPLEIPSGIQMADMIFSPGGEAMLRADFEIVPLSPGFAPAGDVVDLRPVYIGAYIQGSSYFDENDIAVLWYHNRNIGGDNFGFLITQLFDTLGNSLTPEIVVDSAKGIGYLFINMAASPDVDDDIGFAWTSGDTLYSIYFNAVTHLLSDKHKLLTGVTEYHVQMADFLQNGDVRIIWRDNDNYVRHKRLSKTGIVVNEETVLCGPLNNFMFAKYASNKNGDFLLAEFHRPPVATDYGIETRKFNANGVAMGDPLWVSDSVPISMSDLVTRYVSISMQEDGKSVVVWSPYGYDVANQRVVKFLHMQFLDENGSRIGEPFRPVQVNTGSYDKGFEIAEQYPFVRLANDTAWLLWSNYNEEFSPVYAQLYMNVQRLTEPVVSGISTINLPELNHWLACNRVSGELMVMVETPAACPATLEVIDLLGRPVGSAVNIALQPGINRVMMTNNALQSQQQGIFLYRLNVNGHFFQGKFLK